MYRSFIQRSGESDLSCIVCHTLLATLSYSRILFSVALCFQYTFCIPSPLDCTFCTYVNFLCDPVRVGGVRFKAAHGKVGYVHMAVNNDESLLCYYRLVTFRCEILDLPFVNQRSCGSRVVFLSVSGPNTYLKVISHLVIFSIRFK